MSSTGFEAAAGGQLFCIGDPAGGPAQFGARVDWAGGERARLVVGHDDPAVSWPSFQPGPLDAAGGFKPAGAEVVFWAESPASVPVHLRLWVRAYVRRGPCPQLEVELNGRRARWYLSPTRLDRSGIMGEQTAAGAWADEQLCLPGGWLVAGENHLVLTTCQDEIELGGADAYMERTGAPWWGGFGSGLSWGSIALSVAGGQAPGPSVRLVATPLYLRKPEGPSELVDVVLDAPEGFQSGELELEVGEWSANQVLEPGGRSGGQHRLRIALPPSALGAQPGGEGPGEVAYRLEAHLDGRRLVVPGSFRPARRWRLHLIPHVHLDIGYTDRQGKVAEVHARNLDRALDRTEVDPRFRFAADGSWIVEQFLSTRGPADRRRLLAALRSGQLATNVFSVLFLSGFAGIEEVLRSASFALGLAEHDGVPITYANLTDVPSYSVALPSLLHSMGVGRFLGIANHTRAATEDSDELHVRGPWRWRGPDGAEVVAFFADGYSQIRHLAADPPSVAGLAEVLPRWLARYERPEYVPADLPIVGVHTDNEDFADVPVEAIAAWNERFAFPSIRFSTPEEYFAAIEPLAERLPLLEGDGGSYWEDGIGSDPGFVAGFRRAQALVAGADGLSALIGSSDSHLGVHPERFKGAWADLVLCAEHTWTWAHSTRHPHAAQSRDQLEWKHDRLVAATRVGADEALRSLSQLTEQVSTTQPSLVVYNPSSWPRALEATYELDRGIGLDREDPGVESGIVQAAVMGEVDGLQQLRLRVEQVPPLGYRLVRVARDREASGAALRALPAVLELARYRLELEPASGEVRSLWHREMDWELVDRSSALGFASVITVEGGGSATGRGWGNEATRLVEADPFLPAPDLALRPARLALIGHRRLPWGDLVYFGGEGHHLQDVSLELSFADDDDRVGVTVSLTKEGSLAKESLYVAFPFALRDPRVRYDRQIGWVDPTIDHVPGACNEWFTHQYAVVVDEARGSGRAVAWCGADVALFALGDVVRGRWPLQAEASSTILSWVANNHWNTNYVPSQGGRFELRYAFSPMAAADLARAARLGRELRHPALSSDVNWLDKALPGPRPLPEQGCSLLEVDAPDHVLVSPYSDQGAVLVRVQEVAGRSGSFRLRRGDRVHSGDIGPYALRTLRVE